MTSLKMFTRVNKKNQQTNIRVRFCQGRIFDLTAKTGKQINPEYWNNDKGCVRRRAEFSGSEKLQIELDELTSFILREFNNEPNKSKINKQWLNATIDKHYNPKEISPNNKTLFDYIDGFIKIADKRINITTGKPISYKTQREYATTFDYLKDYSKEYGEPDFDDIDRKFHQQFCAFLREKGLAENTLGKKIKTIKVFMNAATEDNINTSIKYKCRNFVAPYEETDHVFLNEKELDTLYEYDFSNNPGLEKVRDRFIVAAWTGLRFSDISKISSDKIDGDYITIKQQKTGKKVTIPINYRVHEILKKYNGTLPEGITNQKYNLYIKECAKIAGLNKSVSKTKLINEIEEKINFLQYELISSHTARRSFCSNAYLDNFHTLDIQAISGHKTEKMFLLYIRVDPKEHAKRIFDGWRKKRSLRNDAVKKSTGKNKQKMLQN